MVGNGFHHVLAGADHLLFLTALLLAAPVVVVAGRWRRRTGLAPTLAGVLGVVTSFTSGHSLTLVASSLGWVHVPTQLVEVLVATSVAVAALHAIRPLVRQGETLIAGGFGLVHGLAFAGILSGLGLDGSASLVTLFAFNFGVELAKLTATMLLFPSLYLLARTRFYPAVRIVGGSLAITAATGWVLERLGVVANPLGGRRGRGNQPPLVRRGRPGLRRRDRGAGRPPHCHRYRARGRAPIKAFVSPSAVGEGTSRSLTVSPERVVATATGEQPNGSVIRRTLAFANPIKRCSEQSFTVAGCSGWRRRHGRALRSLHDQGLLRRHHRLDRPTDSGGNSPIRRLVSCRRSFEVNGRAGPDRRYGTRC